MLKGLWLAPITFVSLWGPIVFVFVVFVWQCVYWRRKVTHSPGKKIELSVEVFCQSIAGALTVSSIVMPLLFGGIGYFALQGVAFRDLVPLLGSGILFVLSLSVGLWNLFSLTTATDDKLEITPTESGGFVPQFVVQLALMFAAFFVIGIYLLFFFKLPAAAGDPPPVTATVIRIERPALAIGLKASEVTTLWGRPDTVVAANGKNEWRYRSDQSVFVVTMHDDVVESILQQRKD